MGANRLGNAIRFGAQILATTVADKSKLILAQIGDAALNFVETDAVEMWQHIGFVSRPSIPTDGKNAAEAIILTDSQYDKCIATRDARGAELAGNLGPGETCVYAPGADGKSQGRILLKDNGTVAIVTAKGNTKEGTTVIIQVEGDTGAISMANEFGGLTINEDGITLMCGASGLKLGADGNVALMGTAIAINGSSVSLGANAIMPVVWGPAGLSGVGSTSVKVAI